MAIDTSLITRAITGLEQGNVWIALNSTFTDIQVIPKDPCPLKCVKKFFEFCGWNYYEHLNPRNIVQHLKTRDWSAVDPNRMDYFYTLFQRSIAPSSPQPLVTEIDKQGNTQLHRAVLLRQRVNMHSEEVFSRTAQEIIRLLRLGVDPTVQNQRGDTILHLVADLPYWGVGHNQLVEILLRYGAKANVPNKQGVTAFHLIIAAKPSISIVKSLIKRGLADVNAQDNKGDAAFHKVASSDRSMSNLFNLLVAKELLKHGAKVDMPNKKGNTPLHTVIISREDIKKAVRFFCNEGHANINAQNHDGDTPLHLLAGFNQWDKRNHRGTVKWLLTKGANKTLVNKKGELPLHKAYNRSDSEVIALLETENMQETDSEGQTPLHLAAKDFYRDIQAFKRIFANSINTMAADKWGNTPLHNAAKSGFYQAVEFLIEKGFSVNASNAEGNSPLYLAVWSLLASYEKISSAFKLKEMERLITILDSAKTGSSKKVRFTIDPGFEHLYNNVLKTTINFLLDHGANPYQKNKKEISPVEHCFNWTKMFSSFDTARFLSKVRESLEV